MSTPDQEELRENFDHFDRNNDGRIDRDEFSALMEAIDALEPGEDPSLGFSAIDVDGNGLVEFDEFVRWFADR